MTPAGTYIEANGLRAYYEAYGEGEPLLLIHGGTATCRSWASHLPAFAERFRVFASDSRGHGRTDNPAGELGYRVMADDVAALVGALGWQRPLILGYSDGGQIALELGMRYPGLARALVLGGTQFRISETYLEDARSLLGTAEGEEVDPEKLEREQPDFVAYLREAHGHLASLWLTPLCSLSTRSPWISSCRIGVIPLVFTEGSMTTRRGPSRNGGSVRNVRGARWRPWCPWPETMGFASKSRQSSTTCSR
jgi:pimeloyl-ACP methyl ester carboxylesterase